MSGKVSAIYESGTLILEQPLSISEDSKVEVVVFSKEKKDKTTVAEIVAEIAALPLEGKTDKFSGRDHDKILYGEDRKK